MRWIRGLKWYFYVILAVSLFYLGFNMLNSPLRSDWLKPLNTASRKISSDLLDSLNVESRMVSENFPINLPEHYMSKQYWWGVKGNSTGCLRYPALRDIHFSNSHWQKVYVFLWNIFSSISFPKLVLKYSYNKSVEPLFKPNQVHSNFSSQNYEPLKILAKSE